MAFLMLSAGMLTDFASAMMVRSRGFEPGSPPPLRAATVNSLMMRVKTLPRLASAAPFLCLIVCHLEWPDIRELQKSLGLRTRYFIPKGLSGPRAQETEGGLKPEARSLKAGDRA